MNILLLSPYPPYPPHGGGTMRIYQLARGLAEHHDVTCLSFAADAATERALAPLQRICRVVTVRGPASRGLPRRAWTTLTSPLPDMALRNAAPAYAAALRALLATETFDIVQAESIEMAGYLLHTSSHESGDQSSSYSRSAAGSRQPAAGGAHPSSSIFHPSMLVLDQFNAEYVLQKRAALNSLRATIDAPIEHPTSKIQHLAGGMYSLAQWQKLARYEARVMRACDLVLAVAEEDRAIMRALAPGVPIGVVPNGVDTAAFSRAALLCDRSGPIELRDSTLVFSGTLDFRPNVDAITWFVREVLPLLWARRPGIRLLVVGKRPAPALLQLAAEGALVLTGEVPDARPYIAGAAVYIVPMRIGGGVRLKLLEALALEAAVVSTAMGAEGVAGLRGGEHCLLADEPAGFAAAVLRLLDDRPLGQRLGAAGRALVRERYDWQVIVPRLEAIYQGARAAHMS
ncbi:MAG: glycosyltransferase [Kouleothrix sp.]|nr:glycosyltransferase [Kouleothrix sp.]